MSTELSPVLADLRTSEVLDRVSERWRFVDGRFPVPRGEWLECAVCGSSELQLSRYHFHRRTDSQSEYRCDVKLKCTVCSHTQTHAPVLTERQYRRGMGRDLSHTRSRQWGYREVLEELEAA